MFPDPNLSDPESYALNPNPKLGNPKQRRLEQKVRSRSGLFERARKKMISPLTMLGFGGCSLYFLGEEL